MLNASDYPTENRYPALLVIAGIFKVLAVLAAIFGVIGAVIGLLQMAQGGRAGAGGGVIALVSLLYGGLICIYMFAASEAIKVFIDIEGNTRLSNELLRRLLEK